MWNSSVNCQLSILDALVNLFRQRSVAHIDNDWETPPGGVAEWNIPHCAKAGSIERNQSNRRQRWVDAPWCRCHRYQGSQPASRIWEVQSQQRRIGKWTIDHSGSSAPGVTRQKDAQWAWLTSVVDWRSRTVFASADCIEKVIERRLFIHSSTVDERRERH